MRAPGVTFDFAQAVPARRIVIETGVPLFVGDWQQVDGLQVEDNVASLSYEHWQALEEAQGVGWATGVLGFAVRGFFENGGRRCLLGKVAKLEDLQGFIDGVEHVPDDFDLVCAPDLAAHWCANDVKALVASQLALVGLCSARNGCMAVLDAPERPSSVSYWEALTNRPELRDRDAALYAPWLRVRDAVEFIPPSGHVAGLIAGCDRRVGVHKPPANEVMQGIIELAEIADQGAPPGLNRLRAFRSRGIRVWGAQTLAASADSSSISVRRVFHACVRWIDRFAAAVAFEPSDLRLWTRINRELGCFLDGMYRRGALMGSSAAEAFFVKCDSQNNPPGVRERGEVVAEVGLAIARPTEYVIVRMVASPDGTTTHELRSPDEP